MKTLKESLLDDIETTMNNGVLAVAEDVVRDIIQKEYKLYKRYKSDITVVGKAESGKILINGKGKIEFINKTAKSVVNDIFEWNEIKGEFMCFKCNIESLEGFPRKVDASNILGKCAINVNQCKNLKTLKGAPDIIFGDFYCIECDSLTSLEGAPEKVAGDFFCGQCDSLKTLKGAPKYLSGEFNCSGCKNLESLEGVPDKIYGDFDCSNCKSLKSLKGLPKYLSGEFNCSGCKNLESLEGVPDKIYGDFDCSNCKSLKSLKGLPSSIGGSLYLPKIDSLFNEEGAEIISKISVKGDPCVVPLYR